MKPLSPEEWARLHEHLASATAHLAEAATLLDRSPELESHSLQAKRLEAEVGILETKVYRAHPKFGAKAQGRTEITRAG